MKKLYQDCTKSWKKKGDKRAEEVPIGVTLSLTYVNCSGSLRRISAATGSGACKSPPMLCEHIRFTADLSAAAALRAAFSGLGDWSFTSPSTYTTTKTKINLTLMQTALEIILKELPHVTPPRKCKLTISDPPFLSPSTAKVWFLISSSSSCSSV